jgi:uncharacterized protein (TIGR03000 family)
MRKLLIAVAATLLVLDTGASAWARHGCGGGRHHGRRGGSGGCGSACGTGGCGMAACGGCGYGGYGYGAYGSYGGYGTYGAFNSGGMYYGTYLPAEDAVQATAISQPATLVVELPADATLTVDGTATSSTSSSRLFITPALQAGRTYTYTLTAQVMRDGGVQTVTREVAVRAGEETRVQLDMPGTAVVAR